MPIKRRPKPKATEPVIHPAHEHLENSASPDITLEEAKNKIKELEEQLRILSLQTNNEKNITLNHTLDQSKTRSKSAVDSPQGKKVRRGSTSILKKNQSSTGCSCSGDCGSKRCGCVKKDKACGEFCKCTDLCKNQDDKAGTNSESEEDTDKENEKQNVQVPAKRETKVKAEKFSVTPVDRVTRNRRLKMLVDEESSSSETPVSPPKPRSLFDTPTSEQENQSSSNEPSPAQEQIIVNPMKPRHQLPRSPPNKNISLNNSERLDLSKSRSPSPNVSSSSAVGSAKKNDSLEAGSSKFKGLSPSSNPMQPKHKLARSPITELTVADRTRSKSPNLVNNTSVFHDDDVFLPIPTPDSSKVSPPPPPEIYKERVDWDQHQAELVVCRKCKRKFYPYRIEVHEKSCKGI